MFSKARQQVSGQKELHHGTFPPPAAAASTCRRRRRDTFGRKERKLRSPLDGPLGPRGASETPAATRRPVRFLLLINI